MLTKLKTYFLLSMSGKFGKELKFLIISESIDKLEHNNRTNGSCKCLFDWRNPQNSTNNLKNVVTIKFNFVLNFCKEN